MNEQIKEAILTCGVEKEVSHARFIAFSQGDRSLLKQLEERYGQEVIEVCKNMLYGNYRKQKKVKDKTRSIVEAGECIFLTLTFNDATLARTSEKTRRRYVSRYLKKECSSYVANIDFGKKNEREHYHALVYAPRVDYSKWHKYGAIKGERVKPSENDAKAVAKYVAKLSLHAIKETAGKGRRIIYSRRTDYLPPAFLFADD